VGHECYFQIAGFDCWYASGESSGLGATHNTGSEIDKIGAVIYNNGGRGARTIWVRHRCASAEQDHFCPRWPILRRLACWLL